MVKLKVPVVYKQGDPAWAAVLLGYNTAAPFTIGLFGCLLTSLAMYLTALGRTETPLSINQKLKDNKGFAAGSGDLIWESLQKIWSDMTIKFKSERYVSTAFPDSLFTKMKQFIDDGYPCLLEIDFNPSQAGEQMHFVLCYGYDDANYYIADPWSGTKTVLSVYGPASQAMIGFTVYNLTLAEDLPGTFVDQPTFEKLVHNSEVADSAVRALSLVPADGHADNISKETIAKSVAGLQGAVTKAQSDVATWMAEAKTQEALVGTLNGKVTAAENATEALRKADAILIEQKDTRITVLEGIEEGLNTKVSGLTRDLALCQGTTPPSTNWLQKLIDAIFGKVVK